MGLKDISNEVDDEDFALAVAIARLNLGEVEDRPVHLNIGTQNKVFRVKADSQTWVIRFTQDRSKLSEYEKERWCGQQARLRGVRTPATTHFGIHETFPYAIQRYVDGKPGNDPAVDSLLVWRALGNELAKIHSIATNGRGLEISDPETATFSESWEEHIQLNVAKLTPSDPLLTRGHITAAESRELKAYFVELEQLSLNFALGHGDIAPRNTIVDAENQVHLLDWGCAFSHVVPYHEFSHIMRFAELTPAELDMFLEGYGMSRAQFAQIDPLIRSFGLLSAVDTLRWAIAHEHEAMDRYVAGARWAIGQMGVSNQP